MNNLPFVSIIIPCRNEARFIRSCLDSIISQDYPKDKLEVIIVDGKSEDSTREIIMEYTNNYTWIKLIDNIRKIVPTALNMGIKEAKGEIIIRMDAHTVYEKDYISKCTRYLREYNVDNVGGVWVIMPRDNTIFAKSIALALSHPFGVGNAYYRIGLKEPKFVDTVPFGCYKREVFSKIGIFNENLVRNQDIEFNLRLKKEGGKILLLPDIISYYHSRSNFKDLFRQNFWNGFWVVYSLKFAKVPFSIRHLIPLFFVISLICSLFISLFYYPFKYLFVFILGFYFFVNIFFCSKISLKHGFKYFPFLFIAFLTLHFSYGLGSVWGGIKLFLSKVWKKQYAISQ